jgi:hypothetical protein
VFSLHDRHVLDQALRVMWRRSSVLWAALDRHATLHEDDGAEEAELLFACAEMALDLLDVAREMTQLLARVDATGRA